ncbi:PHP domain-containing protein [Cohnella cholangitidis]|uniref:PHP domain-containing protein n=1 Tax=Cohnella cholangitidis TaxID=2598458 RepID=A0A7G5BTJ1_9BACL|nr:PHP domain-containing protein [Cohnella cholangitidis]QMV40275.1 PHP domain-containing protein [Cohnella cholangitidis]
MIAKADLHTHTTASDGMFRPAENVRLAKEAGLSALAITDHDTIAGVEEALAAGREYGITVIPGMELSTSADGKDIHILGYGISTEDSVLLSRLQAQRNVRNRRNEEILNKLAELNMHVSLEELEAAAGKSRLEDGSIGRPHIAQVLVDKGYVADKREAFERLLGEGKPAYASLTRIAPTEAIRWIHEAGGIAIIAHPGLYGDDDLVLTLLDSGADGLEAFHSDHDERMEQRYAEWAENRGKLVTGGSDFHGVKDGVAFHGDIGNRTVDASIVDKLLRNG